MNNHLIYVRVSDDKAALADPPVFDQVAMTEQYAKRHGWNVVGYVVDRHATSSSHDQAGCENLYRYLQKYQDIDVVVCVETEPSSSAGYAAVKAILESKAIRLVVITISERKDTEPADDLCLLSRALCAHS